MNEPDPILEKNISALIRSQQINQMQVSETRKEFLFQSIQNEWRQSKQPVYEFPKVVLVALSLLVMSGFFTGLVLSWQQGINTQPLSVLMLFSGAVNLFMVPIVTIYLIQQRRKRNETLD